MAVKSVWPKRISDVVRLIHLGHSKLIASIILCLLLQSKLCVFLATEATMSRTSTALYNAHSPRDIVSSPQPAQNSINAITVLPQEQEVQLVANNQTSVNDNASPSMDLAKDTFQFKVTILTSFGQYSTLPCIVGRCCARPHRAYFRQVAAVPEI